MFNYLTKFASKFTKTRKNIHFNHLPDPCLHQIFSHLSLVKLLCSYRLVCIRWNALITKLALAKRRLTLYQTTIYLNVRQNQPDTDQAALSSRSIELLQFFQLIPDSNGHDHLLLPSNLLSMAKYKTYFRKLLKTFPNVQEFAFFRNYHEPKSAQHDELMAELLIVLLHEWRSTLQVLKISIDQLDSTTIFNAISSGLLCLPKLRSFSLNFGFAYQNEETAVPGTTNLVLSSIIPLLVNQLVTFNFSLDFGRGKCGIKDYRDFGNFMFTLAREISSRNSEYSLCHLGVRLHAHGPLDSAENRFFDSMFEQYKELPELSCIPLTRLSLRNLDIGQLSAIFQCFSRSIRYLSLHHIVWDLNEDESLGFFYSQDNLLKLISAITPLGEVLVDLKIHIIFPDELSGYLDQFRTYDPLPRLRLSGWELIRQAIFSGMNSRNRANFINRQYGHLARKYHWKQVRHVQMTYEMFHGGQMMTRLVRLIQSGGRAPWQPDRQLNLFNLYGCAMGCIFPNATFSFGY